MPERIRKTQKGTAEGRGHKENNVIAFPKKAPDHLMVPSPKNAKETDSFRVAEVDDYSLIGDRIWKGEYVMFKENFELFEIEKGDLVVADTPEGRLVRHYRRMRDGTIRLSASNPQYKDMYFSQKDVDIQGIVIYSLNTFKEL